MKFRFVGAAVIAVLVLATGCTQRQRPQAGAPTEVQTQQQEERFRTIVREENASAGYLTADQFKRLMDEAQKANLTEDRAKSLISAEVTKATAGLVSKDDLTAAVRAIQGVQPTAPAATVAPAATPRPATPVAPTAVAGTQVPPVTGTVPPANPALASWPATLRPTDPNASFVVLPGMAFPPPARADNTWTCEGKLWVDGNPLHRNDHKISVVRITGTPYIGALLSAVNCFPGDVRGQRVDRLLSERRVIETDWLAWP